MNEVLMHTPHKTDTEDMVAISGTRLQAETAARTEVDIHLLYQMHAAEIGRYLSYMLSDKSLAEDALHDVFITAHKNLQKLHGLSVARAWLYGIAKNWVRDHRKKLARRRTDPTEDIEVFSEGSDSSAQLQQIQIVKDILMKLDDKFSEVLSLSDMLGYSAREIAELTGLPQNTVSSRIRLGRSHFKRLYLETQPGNPPGNPPGNQQERST